MSGRCTVFVSQSAWRVACVDAKGVRVAPVEVKDDSALSEKARAVARLIIELGGTGPVVVAMPSEQCLCATIMTDGLGRGTRRQAMAYLLEEHLPLSAEESIADYVEHHGRALGVSADSADLRQLIETFDAAELSVAHLCPAALLAAAHLSDQHPDAQGFLLDSYVKQGTSNANVHADLIEVHRKTPTRWRWLTDQAMLDEALEVCREQAGESPIQFVTNLDISQRAGFDSVLIEDRTAAAAAYQGALLLAGEARAWIDLRREALAAPGRYQRYQKQVIALVTAAALFLLCASGAAYWRGMQYQQEADAIFTEQTDVFKEVFPDQPVRGGIRNRLVSEKRRLEGVGGQTTDSGIDGRESLQPTSALAHLHAVLTALPNGPRYQVSEIVIEPGMIRLDGQAADSVIPETLAAAVRKTGSYQVDPPNARALNEFGFSFDLIVRPTARPEREAQP